MPNPPYSFAPWTAVDIDDAFWSPRQQINHKVTLQVEHDNLIKTGHIGALKLDWKAGDPNPPHIFWESDLAKWLEAAAYTLAKSPDPALEVQVDNVIALLAGAQQPDGYLNAHFTVVEPEKRWANLRDWHELYCAGHLIEAAVVHFQATGKRSLLDVMIRYADYIDSVFGPEAGKTRGYPGHQEIELALVRLYHVTDEARYLKLAQYFINERGTQPHYYDQEARARGEDPASFWAKSYEYNQSHQPVREQSVAVGHSVRALYMYIAMADLARETGDESLLRACERLYESILRRMYITGAAGSSRHNEGFTGDFDLPNEDAYAETCASIALVFWMQRMLQLDCDGKYADTLERALYNGVLSGISLAGDTFFYVNPLAVHRSAHQSLNERHTAHRRSWFGCACCPPNIARLLASLGGYIYAASDDTAVIHLYVGSSAQLQLGGQPVILRQQTEYPWDGAVTITVQPQAATAFALKLRVPGWCKAYAVTINGEKVNALAEKGYLRLERTWQPGDQIGLNLTMPVERIYADPRVRANNGRVALQRGPVIYCLEGTDNGNALETWQLPSEAPLSVAFAPDLLGGVVVITGEARKMASWDGIDLYHDEPPAAQSVALTAVPYYAWDNRGEGDLLVWVREG